MATPPSSFASFSDFVAQVLLAAQTGSVQSIPNALASSELDTAILTDPQRIQAYRESIATQLNDGSGGPRFEDLSERIADIIIETNAQAAGTLEVHLVDPYWVIPTSGFIQADENGFLWPPIDIRFPSDTQCIWRLCQYRPSWSSGTQANLVLTFEDRIVSLLRDLSPGNGGVWQGLPNQTLGGFIKMLVDSTNSTLKPVPRIQLLEMISPQDPNFTAPITQLPKHAENKIKKGLDAQMQQLLNTIDQHQLGAFPGGGPAGSKSKPTTTTMTQAEQDYAQAWAQYALALERNPNLAVGTEDP